MSLSLLNEYLSSDDEQDDHLSPANTSSGGQTENGKTTKNFFICNSSESDVSSCSDNDVEFEENESTTKPQLPRPFDRSLQDLDTSSVSVFRNPFMEAERAETSILEQHVKLTETAYGGNSGTDRQRNKDRRSSAICRQFKRGRCRMGDKCKFIHSLMPLSADGTLTSSVSAPIESPSSVTYDSKAVRYTEWGQEEIVDAQGDDDTKRRKRRRVGTTNSLVPPKRALANYEKQRQEEAPWLNNQR